MHARWPFCQRRRSRLPRNAPGSIPPPPAGNHEPETRHSRAAWSTSRPPWQPRGTVSTKPRRGLPERSWSEAPTCLQVKNNLPRVIFGAACTLLAGISACLSFCTIMSWLFGQASLPSIPHRAEATVVRSYQERDGGTPGRIRTCLIVRYVDDQGKTNTDELWTWSAQPRYSTGSPVRIHYQPGPTEWARSPDFAGFTSIYTLAWLFTLAPLFVVPLVLAAYCLLNGIPLGVVLRKVTNRLTRGSKSKCGPLS